MKLTRVSSDDIVVIRQERRYAVAEARELKLAGFGQRQVMRIMSGEWRLQARSYRDFQRLAATVPVEYVGMIRFTDRELAAPVVLPSARCHVKNHQTNGAAARACAMPFRRPEMPSYV